MKKIYVLLILLFSLHYISSALSFKIGDSIDMYNNKNNNFIQTQEIKLSKWPEGELEIKRFTTESDNDNSAILFSGKLKVGILQGSRPDAHFLLDMDNDGILDLKTDVFVLPYWVVTENSPVKSQNNNLKVIFDRAYESFQSDAGPMAKKSGMKESLKELMKFADENLTQNRDLAYMMLFYQVNSQQYKREALACIEDLTKKYSERFGEVHPLLILYRAETFVNIGMNDNAVRLFGELALVDPDFIPAKCYLYRFEKDKDKAGKMLNELKNKHPDHWIVKQL